jgi:tetratricopeptide (TPR) repeat protein
VYIASVQYHLGQYSSALLSYHDALECYHNIDEIEDVDKDTLQEHIALTLYYMGVVQAALCDYNTAMITLKDAHTIQQELFGIDNLQTLRTRLEISNLNTLYIDDVPIAMKYFQSIIAAQHRLHNVDRHPSIADTLHSIGLAYLRQKDYTKALRTLEDCYYMRMEFFGSDHPVLATTLFDLAKVYLLVQRHGYQNVLQICDHVLHIRLLKLHEKHIDIARVYVMKGKCYVAIGKTDDAHQCFTDAYNMAKQCLNSDGDDDSNNVNENHILFAEIYTEWSTLYLMKCQFDVARSYIDKARIIYQTNLHMDDDYDGIIEAQHILHRIEHDEMLCV